ncbi:phage tail protein I [Vibrio sp. St2]|uniref:phage tail protein I n=1 Tax=Vibrio sp. St2 TaxID=2853441 RepID=UPI00248D4F87|nr:phage tail protein I [Vibrio sp. St2]
MSLLPPGSTDYEKALEQVTKSDMSSPIRYLWNPKECPVELLYVLAITFDVDEWDESWPEEFKRQTLVDAYLVHSLKGTPASVRLVLKNAGYQEVILKEGLNINKRDGSRTRNGHFYYGYEDAESWYRVYLQRPITIEQSKQVTRMLNIVAPLECELKGLHFEQARFLYNGKMPRDGSYTRGVA